MIIDNLNKQINDLDFDSNSNADIDTLPFDEKKNEIKIQTYSDRNYNYKAVGNYKIGISPDEFNIRSKILGKKGINLKKIIYNCALIFNDKTTKIRLRGKGSGYKEGKNHEESNEPLQLSISSQNIYSFHFCCQAIEKLLNKIYFEYYVFEYQLKNNGVKNNQFLYPIMKKKIDKNNFLIVRNWNF